MKVCPQSGCPNWVPCPTHKRDTAGQRGYSSRGHRAFRNAVLTRDPVCVLCRRALATVADHYPLSRRDLIEQGLNPNDPARGRGLCASCHGVETARWQPGGFRSTE